MLKEFVEIEIQTKFLYPGIVLKGDAFDDNDNLIVERDVPFTEMDINSLNARNTKAIHYKRERLKLKKDVSSSMIDEKNIEAAIGVMHNIEVNLQNKSNEIPVKEVKEVIGNFVKDIKSNEDAYLNLLDLMSYDDYTYTHSINVSSISILLGVSMNLDENKLNYLGIAGLLHDIGKTLIPEKIVNKPSKLDPDEWTIMKNHPVYGYNIVRAEKNFPAPVEQAILLHHENYKGGGYPMNLNHEKLDYLPQIISVADVFDAITSVRSYKTAGTINEAFTYLMENSGTKFSPQIAQVFLRDMVKKINEEPLYPVNCYVQLNTGEIAFVIGHRKSLFSLRPIINIFLRPTTGKSLREQMMKYFQQIDLEQDYSRFILKKIINDKYIEQFNILLGEKGPNATPQKPIV